MFQAPSGPSRVTFNCGQSQIWGSPNCNEITPKHTFDDALQHQAQGRLDSTVEYSYGRVLSHRNLRYEIPGEELARYSWLRDRTTETVEPLDSARAGRRTITLKNVTACGSLSDTQRVAISPGQHLLMLSCEDRSMDVVPGKMLWDLARAVLIITDRRKQAAL